MTARPLGARRRLRRAAAWIAATVVGGTAWAQSTVEAPDVLGFPVGGVVIGPSLTVGYSRDTNPLQLTSDTTQPDQPVDNVFTLQPALQLVVPFSNSKFRFGDVFNYVDYKVTPQNQGKTSNDAVADLTLNFGSLDQLDLSAHNISGVSDTVAFDQGKTSLNGNAYALHSEAVSISRKVEGGRGYLFSLERNALRFDPDVNPDFFNYRGFDGEAAYLQPLSPNMRLSFGYEGSRYDHFPVFDPSTVGRTEAGDTIYGEIAGQLGPKQPYSVRLGWEQLHFAGQGVNADDHFSGVVGRASLSAVVGGGTAFTVGLLRQPYRSSIVGNNYYIYDQIGGAVNRDFPRGSSFGGSVGWSRNSFNQPITVSQSNEQLYRRDRTIRLEAYANLALAKHVVFRVSLVKNRRRSNDDGADFNQTALFGGFVLGWI